MNYFLLIFACCFSSFCYSQIIISGSMPELAGEELELFRYTDEFTKQEQEVATTFISESGGFSVSLNDGLVSTLVVRIGAHKLTFITCRATDYSIGLEDEKLMLLSEGDCPLNELLKEVEQKLSGLRSFYTDQERDDETIIEQIDSFMNEVEAEYTGKLDEVDRLLPYLLGRQRLTTHIFIHPDDLQQRIIELEKVIDRAPLLQNPYYARMADTYIWGLNFIRHWKNYRIPIPINGLDKFTQLEDPKAQLILHTLHIYDHFTNNRAKNRKKCLQHLEILESRTTDTTILAIMDYYKARMLQYQAGDVFPDVTLLDHNKKPVSLHEIKADYILIDFWATWCAPCKSAMEKFPDLQDEYGDKLAIVGISVDADIEKMIGYKEEQNYNWIFLHTGREGLNREVSINSYPSYFLLDKDKKVLEEPRMGFEVAKMLKKHIR